MTITATSTLLYLNGNARKAAEHLLSAPAASRLQEIGTFTPVTSPGTTRPIALEVRIPDAEIARLSTGEKVLVQVLIALGRPSHAVRLGAILTDVDDLTFDAIVGALVLARGRHLEAIAS